MPADGAVDRGAQQVEGANADVVRALDAAGVATTDLHRREATLDDVFLAITDPDPTPTTEEVAA